MTVKKLYKWIITVNLLYFNIFISVAQVSTDFIDKLQLYQNSVRLLRGESGEQIDSTTFNLNQYMSMLNKLHIEPDKTLRVEYFDTFSAGRPYIYACDRNFNLDKYLFQEALYYSTNSGDAGIIIKKGVKIKLPKLLPDSKEIEYVSKNNDTIINDENAYKRYTFFRLDKFLNDSSFRAYNHLIPDNSEEGYLQYLFFYTMGEQFAFKWHALYDEQSIITSTKQIKQIIKQYRGTTRFETDKKELKKLLKINPAPIINMQSDSCMITWYEIETHNGIYERTYKISKVAPYKIQRINEKQLVGIGMNFIY